MTSILGIDEAGRGPILGPLVIAGVKISDSKEKKLKKLGVKDSKLLSHEKREELFPKIFDLIDDSKICIVSPQEVDAALVSQTSNLNWLEADYMCQIINHLQPDKAYMDCPSPNIKKFTEYLQNKLTCASSLFPEHKADVNYPVCSAASILAKVTRDREIEKIKQQIGINCGSGYATDPATQKFLKKHYEEFPDIFRKNWDTCRLHVFNKSQTKLEF